MGRHVAYWQELAERGTAIVLGPVSDPAGAWGLAVVAAETNEQVRALGDADPPWSRGWRASRSARCPARSLHRPEPPRDAGGTGRTIHYGPLYDRLWGSLIGTTSATGHTVLSELERQLSAT